jgi:hypothetical protein
VLLTQKTIMAIKELRKKIIEKMKRTADKEINEFLFSNDSDK